VAHLSEIRTKKTGIWAKPRCRFNPQTSPSFARLLEQQSRSERKRWTQPVGKTSRRSSLDSLNPPNGGLRRQKSVADRRASLTEGISPQTRRPLPEIRGRGSPTLGGGRRLSGTPLDLKLDVPKPTSMAPALRSGSVSPPAHGLSPIERPSDASKAQSFIRDSWLSQQQRDYLHKKERENNLAEKFARFYKGMKRQIQYWENLAEATKPPDFCAQLVEMNTSDMIKNLRAAKAKGEFR